MLNYQTLNGLYLELEALGDILQAHATVQQHHHRCNIHFRVGAFLHARSLFFFCESFHALLKRWSVHIFWITESLAPNGVTNSETR